MTAPKPAPKKTLKLRRQPAPKAPEAGAPPKAGKGAGGSPTSGALGAPEFAQPQGGSLATPAAAKPAAGALAPPPWDTEAPAQKSYEPQPPQEAADPALALSDLLRLQRRRVPRVDDFWEQLT